MVSLDLFNYSFFVVALKLFNYFKTLFKYIRVIRVPAVFIIPNRHDFKQFLHFATPIILFFSSFILSRATAFLTGRYFHLWVHFREKLITIYLNLQTLKYLF